MPYATLDDLLTAYGPVASMIGTGSFDVTSTQVESYFIANAEDIVNAAVADRYVVPLAEPVSGVIRRAVVDIVICDMVSDKLPKTPEFLQRRCDRAMTTLGKIRDGKLDLTSQTLTSSNGGDFEAWSSTQQHHPTFSPVLDPVDQTVDRDFVNAENDEREGDHGARGTFFDDC